MTKRKPQLPDTYCVYYESKNHFAVLTQRHGSTWPKVLPFCILNVAILLFSTYFDDDDDSYFGISNQGHVFIGAVIAFLMVSRVNTALSRFNEARSCLKQMYQETRGLISNIAVLSSCKENRSDESKEWRYECAYRTLIMLRTAMAVLDYTSDVVPAWSLPELSGEELEDIKKNIYDDVDVRRYYHEERLEYEETMRVPIRVAYLLRKAIHSNKERLPKELHVVFEVKLLNSVDAFMGAFHGIRKFLTTPVPFPLIQMARTFLFAYVFTVPFVLVKDESSLFAHIVEVFVLTYGFVGLEIVAMELDNPFGHDVNDFNNLAMARIAMEDCYLVMLDADGPEWAKKLQNRMNAGLSTREATETTALIV